MLTLVSGFLIALGGALYYQERHEEGLVLAAAGVATFLLNLAQMVVAHFTVHRRLDRQIDRLEEVLDDIQELIEEDDEDDPSENWKN